jgi:hypothetical protein
VSEPNNSPVILSEAIILRVSLFSFLVDFVDRFIAELSYSNSLMERGFDRNSMKLAMFDHLQAKLPQLFTQDFVLRP